MIVSSHVLDKVERFGSRVLVIAIAIWELLISRLGDWFARLEANT